jgi:hypothetical protein
MNNDTIILVLGPAGCGKDTVSKLIAEQTGLKWTTTSALASPWMWRVCGALCVPYKSERECHADRGKYRQLWATCMAVLNWADGTGYALYSHAVDDGYRVLNGFRRLDELEPFLSYLIWTGGVPVRIVWVDDAERRAAENRPQDSTMEFSLEDIVLFKVNVLDNNGPESDLPKKVAELLVQMGVKA